MLSWARASLGSSCRASSELLQRPIVLSKRAQRGPEIHMRCCMNGVDSQGRFVVPDGAFVIPTLRQDASQIVFDDPIVVRHRECALKERASVLPVPELNPGGTAGRDDKQGRDGRQSTPAPGQSLDEVGPGPRNHHEDPYQRHVGVPICHGLRTDLNQADHRRQGHQVPRPSKEEVGPAPRFAEREERHERQNDDSRRDSSRGGHTRVRIKDRQVRRPDCFPR